MTWNRVPMCGSVKAYRSSRGSAADRHRANPPKVSKPQQSVLVIMAHPTQPGNHPPDSWSLPQMRRLLQHPLLGPLALAAALTLLVCQPGTSAREPEKLSAAQVKNHKSYVETIPGSKVKFE